MEELKDKLIKKRQELYDHVDQWGDFMEREDLFRFYDKAAVYTEIIEYIKDKEKENGRY